MLAAARVKVVCAALSCVALNKNVLGASGLHKNAARALHTHIHGVSRGHHPWDSGLGTKVPGEAVSKLVHASRRQ